MNRKLHTDDFERMLREMSDEFRMYPSKRIWNSIYNNIHPGRKWPSVVMSIALISTLVLLGQLNTSDTTTDKGLATKPIFAANATISISTNPIGSTAQPLEESTEANRLTIQQTNSTNIGLNNNSIVNNIKKNGAIPAEYTTSASLVPIAVLENKIAQKNKSISQTKSALFSSNQHFNIASQPLSGSIQDKQTNIVVEEPEIEKTEAQSASLAFMQKTHVSDLLNAISLDELTSRDAKKEIAEVLQNEISNINNKQLTQNIQELVSIKDKEWIENYALYNRRASKKWAGKLSWQAYATPSVVYRSLTSGHNFGNAISNPPYAISAANQALQDAVSQIPAMGIEIGSGLQYSVLKGLTIKGSVQLNYTRYNTNAFGNSHPFSAQLTLHDFVTNSNYEILRTTPYSNKSGLKATKLHNETFQISIPIGADLKLMGNEKIQWNIGATIQPTYIAGGNNYLISSDKRNYVKEPSLLNKWNLNAGLETFITFKSNGLTWQVGPQFRTQLYSTNSKQYIVEERLLNYGIKLGVSKIIR
jgi:hypothetical protein